jgi:hypothetical protein
VKVRQAITLDYCDRARISKVDEAWGMIGGHDLTDEGQRPFRRIRGNDFTMQDVDLARAIVIRVSSRPIPEIFTEPRLQDTWAEGQRSSMLLARRTMEEFLEDLREDLA